MDWFLYDRNIRHERVNFAPNERKRQRKSILPSGTQIRSRAFVDCPPTLDLIL